MILKDIVSKIEEISPLSLQEEWDNSGFQLKLNSDDSDIHNVYVCLEATSENIEDAIAKKADFIVTHHPLIFTELRNVSVGDTVGRMIKRLVESGISLYSTHTCFDICDKGNNYQFGKLLGIKDICKIEGDSLSIGRMGLLDKPVTISEFADLCERVTGVSKSFYHYTGDRNAVINKVSWVTGSGSEFMNLSKDNGCDLFVTGDLKYHTAREAVENGINVLDIGHYASEKLFTDCMADIISSFGELNVLRSDIDINPFTEL